MTYSEPFLGGDPSTKVVRYDPWNTVIVSETTHRSLLLEAVSRLIIKKISGQTQVNFPEEPPRLPIQRSSHIVPAGLLFTEIEFNDMGLSHVGHPSHSYRSI